MGEARQAACPGQAPWHCTPQPHLVSMIVWAPQWLRNVPFLLPEADGPSPISPFHLHVLGLLVHPSLDQKSLCARPVRTQSTLEGHGDTHPSLPYISPLPTQYTPAPQHSPARTREVNQSSNSGSPKGGPPEVGRGLGGCLPLLPVNYCTVGSWDILSAVPWEFE